jgi:hypothetical protein
MFLFLHLRPDCISVGTGHAILDTTFVGAPLDSEVTALTPVRVP